jgi:hypothetical protein
MSKNRINIYANSGFNKKIIKKKFKMEQPRSKNWGNGAQCRSCIFQTFTISGSFKRPGSVLSWALTPGLTIPPNSPVIFTSGGIVYNATVISFTETSPIETIVFVAKNLDQPLTILSTDIITLPKLVGNVNGNQFTTPGTIGVVSNQTGQHSKEKTIAPVFGWRKTIDCCKFERPTEEMYKDIWSQSKICKTNNKGNSARTQKPLIESGRQKIKWSTPFTKTARGYHQYRHNVRCSSYERSLEKFDVTPSLTNDAWAFLDAANIKTYRPIYYKSGCYSCCNCCVKTQAIIILNQNGALSSGQFLLNDPITTYNFGSVYNIGPFDYSIQPGLTMEVYAVYVIGDPTAVWSAIVFVRTRDGTCEGILLGNPFIEIQLSKTATINNAKAYDLDFTESKCNNVTSLKQTIYKRSNKKFAANGAVSSGGRLERLKLDTIQGSRIQKRISTGNCDQNRCNTNSKQFTQGYRSSEPRFVTNPVEGGNKTAGFPPTRWRNQYIERGKAIGNIILQKECNNCK